MPTSTLIGQRVLARIAASPYSLTIQYPPVRPAATGVAPGPAPVSPLTGPAPTPQMLPTGGPPTPSKPPVTLKCLWLDSYNSVAGSLQTDVQRGGRLAWLDGAEAVARVSVADAAEDPADPRADTKFTGCESVVFAGHRYRVLSVQPVAASFGPPVTYYVWLRGASKQ